MLARAVDEHIQRRNEWESVSRPWPEPALLSPAAYRRQLLPLFEPTLPYFLDCDNDEYQVLRRPV